VPQLVAGAEKDLGGGFKVTRLLPAATCRTVGPFVFLDHFGPVLRQPEQNFDVRPHPHIGLATVTYLFEGAMLHRDSVGSVQRIEPGAVNWMTAGRGIVHSERAPDDVRHTAHRMHGLQMWVGLPTALEECEPSFTHTPAHALPEFTVEGCVIRVLVGTAFGRTSPVRPVSETLYVHIRLSAGGRIELPCLAAEMAIYPVDGPIRVAGLDVPPRTLVVADAGRGTLLEAPAPAHVVLVGGAALDGPRHLSWNFVSHSRERLAQAALDWEQRRFPTIVGETEFIPLPAHLSVG
jgi:redox-sensitive bicupin YhaK (pirin superfamily)